MLVVVVVVVAAEEKMFARDKSRRKGFLGDGFADVGRVVVCFVGVLRSDFFDSRRGKEEIFWEVKEKKRRVKRSSVSNGFCLFVGTHNVE
jgi:hypothetical protein